MEKATPTKGAIVWLTGLTAAGKSTLARALYKELTSHGYRAELLDADDLRQHLSKGLGFTKEDRDENVRRIGLVASLLARNGVIGIVAAISPYRSTRQEVRLLTDNFIEVHLNAPLLILEQRDTKDLYRRARTGEIRHMAGIDDPYERPLDPEVECRTDIETLSESTAKVVAALKTRLHAEPELAQTATASIAPPSRIVGMNVHPTSYAHASASICHWARQGASKHVCPATVNNVMEAYDSAEFQRVMNEADLVTPDGMPLVWALRLLGHKNASRVYGPDLTPILLQMAADAELAVGFYGGSPEVLKRLLEVVAQRFPKLRVAYSCSPPFRALTPQEDEQVVTAINASGVRILFIGLNTPNQDYWMALHKGRVQAVMVGVGAAFDFLSGTKLQAPRWMMPLGLEWLFRLATEPRRLWKRYLKHNPRYIVLLSLQLLGLIGRKSAPARSLQ